MCRMDFLCNSTMYPVGVKLVSHKIPYGVACELPGGLTAESRAKLMYRTRSCSSERCSFRAMALESSADQMSLLRYCTGHATRNRRVFTYSYVGAVPVCLKKMASVRLHSRLQFPERCRGSKNWCSMEVNSTNIFQIFSAGYKQTALIVIGRSRRERLIFSEIDFGTSFTNYNYIVLPSEWQQHTVT